MVGGFGWGAVRYGGLGWYGEMPTCRERLLWGCVFPGTAEGGLLSVLYSGWGSCCTPVWFLHDPASVGCSGRGWGFPAPKSASRLTGCVG